ncbi:alpha/beta hydrolase [Agrobacterium tumefaciens]|uniref:Peptidase n=1 Tax=Agrobacterium tumefaciens TaxID=358 RepID=A0A2L2LM65_AGRTU|nr:alpha/beta fold hydrolase [Agrobacterium tumefaciens]AVH45419.1 peptidase [Agrobacterium tumefaciens]NSY99148.1 alpha/beta hydrolase [Agrobacterium tumefaciens]
MYEDIEFPLSGVTLRGRLFLPENATVPIPLVIAHSGIGSVAQGIYRDAPLYTDAGLGVLFYDHRNYGLSGGEPRQLVDPWQFGRDLRHVITHVSARADIDENRIALWGISLGGQISLFVAGTDRRVSAVVALVPPVSGFSARTLFAPDELKRLEDAIYADRDAQFRGEEPVRLIVSGEQTPDGPPVMFTDPEGIEFIKHYNDIPSFRNELAIASIDCLFEMETPAYAERITAPLLLVLASEDTVAPVEDARKMFERVTSDKELVEYPGQHYGILVEHYPEILKRSVEWIAKKLSVAGSQA